MASGMTDCDLESLGISQATILARGLRRFEEATSLVLAEVGEDGREYLLTPSAAMAWRETRMAATSDGVRIFLVSAFRSVARQTEIIRAKLDAGMDIDQILTVCAPPGFSEHHTGLAVDIACPDCPELEVDFENTDAFQWLTLHAPRFRFGLSYPRGNLIGYQYEPWHWCFQDAAAKVDS
jgi:D-alanyl-D-alanine carboxypeptidase